MAADFDISVAAAELRAPGAGLPVVGEQAGDEPTGIAAPCETERVTDRLDAR